MPVVVYLDSQDFSRLSDPRTQVGNIPLIRNKLLDYSISQKVIFVFSSAIISEIAPLSPQHSNHAAARARFLSSLCQRNTFISIERIFENEFRSINNIPPRFNDQFSGTGNWFPILGDILEPINLASHVRQELQENLKHKTNRKQRRMAQSMAFRSGTLRQTLINQLLSTTDRQSFDEILEMYPMRPKDCETIYKFILGKASKQQAELAFLESLRDPFWMMQWFAKHSGKMNIVTQWFRQPSQTMLDITLKLINDLKMIHEPESESQPQRAHNFITKNKWIGLQDQMLETISKSHIANFNSNITEQIKASELDIYCPGFSTSFRVIHSSIWDSISRSSRTPHSNDYLDSLHALHAPYVDIFRADRYMAPHIAAHTAKYRTCVVSSLDALIPAIEAKLTERSPQDV